MVVAITFVAIVAGLLLRFRSIVGPLLISFVLAYLFYPLADVLRKKTRLSWRFSVTLIFLLVLLLLIGLLTLGGLALVDQIQNLIDFLDRQIEMLPERLDQWSQIRIDLWGMFSFDLSELDLESIGNQLLNYVQPLLTRTGSVVGAIASGTASFLAWTFFALLVSYFILSDSGGMRDRLFTVRIPGYHEDIQRMSAELSRVWNSFLRGQLLLMAVTIVIYTVVLTVLGVNFSIGLALLAGLARFVPYVGPAVAWTTYGLVTFFQGGNYFGLEQLPYSLLVVGVALLIDVTMDNYVTPRVMGTALRVHPAAVMVAAIISANLFGLIGMVLAAPVLATIQLASTYALNKMFDQDPWAELQRSEPPQTIPITHELRRLFDLVRRTLGEWAQAVYRWVKSRQGTSSKP
ncbi:MAG TPA: AI-2E family transporter [Anaerolineaceae bacterium]|nr:AI-2E family transporter [Anaerolineaceae bacterium]